MAENKIKEEALAEAIASLEDGVKTVKVEVVQNNQDKGIQKLQEDNKAMAKEIQDFMTKVNKSKKVKRTFSKAHSLFFGEKFVYCLNGYNIELHFDGKAHEYPEFLIDAIDSKVAEMLDATMPTISDEKQDLQ